MIEQFFTREKAEAGKELPLEFPDGSVSEYSIFIRGVDSDHFKQAERESVRRAVNLTEQRKNGTLSDEEAEKAYEEEKLKLVASLVIRWTLPEEFTEENVIQLLREAPQIADMINRTAADRKSFFKKESDSLKNMLDGNTGSKNPQQDQSKA